MAGIAGKARKLENHVLIKAVLAGKAGKRIYET